MDEEPSRKRDDWLKKIKDIERDYGTIREGLLVLIDRLSRDSTVARSRLGEVRGALGDVENVYFIRMFAVFENGLRDCWNSRYKRTNPPCEVLINCLASRQKIPVDLVEDVHILRNRRNELVHSGETPRETIHLATARGFLCRFFARLPSHW